MLLLRERPTVVVAAIAIASYGPRPFAPSEVPKPLKLTPGGIPVWSSCAQFIPGLGDITVYQAHCFVFFMVLGTLGTWACGVVARARFFRCIWVFQTALRIDHALALVWGTHALPRHR